MKQRHGTGQKELIVGVRAQTTIKARIGAKKKKEKKKERPLSDLG